MGSYTKATVLIDDGMSKLGQRKEKIDKEAEAIRLGLATPS